MAEPTIDDYVEEALTKIQEIVARSMYSPERAVDLLEILVDRIEDYKFDVVMK